MKKKIVLTCMITFIGLFTYAQNRSADYPTLAVYKLLSNERINLKDSVAIYALNFELSIAKKNKRTIVTDILVNDSLAFALFPSYKKLLDINYSPLMGIKDSIKLIIPILIYVSSPDKIYYKDKYDNPLISLNAAVKAASALYRPSPSYKISKTSFWEAITMEPLIIEITNIK